MNKSAANDPPRIGVIGLGLIAQVAHLPALGALRDRAVVTHLCDIAPGLASTIQRNGWPEAEATTDWTDLLTANLDAVVVCTPGSHGQIAVAMLEAGKHVLAEKPLCLSRAEAVDLDAMASKSGVVLQVGYMKVHEPMVTEMAATLGTIGDPRHIRITVFHPADEPQVRHLCLHRGGSVPPGALDDALIYEAAEVKRALGEVPGSIRALYADVLHGSVVHQFALMRAIIGSVPKSWDSVSANPISAGHDLPEPPCIQATTQLDDRLVATLSWNWVPGYPGYREEVEVIGSRGSMAITLSPPYAYEPPVLTTHLASGTNSRTISTSAGHVDAFRHQMTAFVDAIYGRGPDRATAAHALDDIVSIQSLTARVAQNVGVVTGGESAP
jgi:predicted dehydrogenase